MTKIKGIQSIESMFEKFTTEEEEVESMYQKKKVLVKVRGSIQ